MAEIRETGKQETVSIADLHIQYIPFFTPHAVWNRNMRVMASPHADLMHTMLKHGCDLKRVHSSPYYRERQRRHTLGVVRWTDKYINYHIRKRYAILKSIKKHGYDKSQPILVLKEPFWTTRFSYRRSWLVGPEIWTGAGRASACWALGIKTIPVRWVEDTQPGTNERGRFGEKLPIEEIWKETERCR